MWYNRLKSKYKNAVRESMYFNYLFDTLVSMFEWTVPDDVDYEWLEKWLHTNGHFLAQKQGDKWVFAEASGRIGDINMYGEGSQAIGSVLGHDNMQIKGVIGDDVFICYNNVVRTPDTALLTYSGQLAECDKSIEVNTRLSGFAPFFNSTSQNTANAIKQILAKLKEGEIDVVTSENILQALQAGTGVDTFCIDLINPDRIKNVEYQARLYDTLLRRFFGMYGLNTRSTQKNVQVSVDEINSLDCISWVLPLDMLRQRKKFCDEINAKFNENWDVNFSEVWKQEYTAYSIRKIAEDVSREDVVNLDNIEGLTTDGNQTDGSQTDSKGGASE